MMSIVEALLTILATFLQGPTVVVDISERTLTVTTAEAETTYPVAVGRPGWETPTGGVHAITGAYRTAEPEGAYGPLIITTTVTGRVDGEFNGAIAIHGTNRPELIGSAPSHGCIRLRNDDVVAVAMAVRGGATLRIID